MNIKNIFSTFKNKEEVIKMKKTRAERARIPVHHLKKAEFVWLGSHKCKHGHNYLEHWSCFLQDKPTVPDGKHYTLLSSISSGGEKIGFLDIETSNLDANWGMILTYCIKVRGSKKIYYDQITKKDIKKFPDDKSDKRVVRHLIKDLKRYDRIVTHYGRKFDIPFILTRALICGIPFPHFGSISNDDVWCIARKKLKLNSNRQGTVHRALFGKSNKSHLDMKYWVAAARGNKKALNYVLKHNKIDVIELEESWEVLKDFVSKTNCSI